jgi:thiamine biosynthesis lipoprotein ApbE
MRKRYDNYKQVSSEGRGVGKKKQQKPFGWNVTVFEPLNNGTIIINAIKLVGTTE